MMLRLFKWMLYGSFSAALVAGFFLIGVIHYFSQDLPDHKQLASYQPSTLTRLYAGDGKLLNEYAKEKRIFVPIHAMPKGLKNAFIAAEDQNFYYHPGVDFFSIIRASYQNIYNIVTNQGRGLIGASTITQQVAKNMLLTNERTLTRKVKEAILALRMTMSFSKDRILELYLNEIYLGARSYGVAAASLNYFNKSIDELAIEEAALLAALPKAPSKFDPRRNYGKARDRRNWVIDRMLKEGFITRGQAMTAKNSPITLRSRDRTEIAKADFFAEEVRRWLMETYGEESLYEGGLTVHTTLNPELQAHARKALRAGLISYDRRHGFHGKIASINTNDNWMEKLAKVPPPAGIGDWKMAVVLHVGGSSVQIGFSNGETGQINFSALKWAQRSEDGFWKRTQDILKEGDVVAVEKLAEGKSAYGLRQVPKINGALVAMDPHTGRVLAMVGGLTYENSQFNRATQAKRQPGSAFKPFVYLSAMEKGYTPATLIEDEPIEFEMLKRKGVGDEEDEIEVWAPQNYSGDFYGPTTLRVGLEKSRNVMTVHLGMMLGMEAVQEIATRFGIVKNPPRNMSTVLGAAETSLLDLTTAYTMLVSGGKRTAPALVERIQDRNGKTIYSRDTRPCEGCVLESLGDIGLASVPEIPDEREQITDRRSAFQVVSMLEGAVKRGTGVRARKIGKPVAGKTGTTNSSVDTWFMGFSPDLVTGVYVGFDQPKTLGEKETGASAALPIFVDFMMEALKNKPSVPFRIPPDIKMVKIDAKTGFLPTIRTPHNEAIFEAFKAGTEPKISVDRTLALPAVNSTPSRVAVDEQWSMDPRVINSPAARGTGGIY